eukprot:scaffold89666_cov63-Phaeocystis_antarctica.AAC.1
MPPYCTYGLRVPVSCVPYAPEAPGSLPGWGTTVRTPYACQLRVSLRRTVAAGDELLTCYGADYWLALTCGRPEGAPALELTGPIRGAVADSAACLRERAQGVARDYAADAAALEAVFAQLSADGGE